MTATATATLPIADRRPRTGTPRMRVLCVLESTNQLYSGIGRNLFESARHLAGRVEYEFAIDDWDARNLQHLRRFAAEHELAVNVGRGRLVPGQCGPINEGLPELLRARRWDAVEVTGWANSASHSVVLDTIGDTVLGYTPHDQPTWTVEFSEEEAAHVSDIHARVVRRGDVVFCDSPWERGKLQGLAPGLENCQYVPLGCDFEAFRAGTTARRPQLLFVGDLREHRKRFDRVIDVFGRLQRHRPDLRLLVLGNRGDEAGERIPDHLRPACDLRGYVSEAELRRAYAESLGLFLLSDFEAFGLPILEALACGTPVFLSRQDVTVGVFGDYPGAHFCPADDTEVTAAIVGATLARGDAAILEVLRDRDRLRSTFDWASLADRKWRALSSAWFYREHWPWK